MVYCSKSSRKRYYHTADCGYYKQTAERNLLTFRTPKEARANGYNPCPHCCPIGRQYRKDRKAIDAFCNHYGFKHFIFQGDLYVVSDKDTAWRICSLESKKANKRTFLLHESKSGVTYSRLKTPYEEREYHLQRIPEKSLMDYLVYILDHDILERERQEINQQEREKVREEAQYIKAVQKQIGRQNRKKRGSAQSNSQKRRRSKQQLKALASSISNYKSAKAAHI